MTEHKDDCGTVAAARYVGVHARVWAHAVWVPDDLPKPEFRALIRREGEGGLVLHGSWKGLAACGQMVDGIVAGPNGGHDWDRLNDSAKCPRCVRAIQNEERP